MKLADRLKNINNGTPSVIPYLNKSILNREHFSLRNIKASLLKMLALLDNNSGNFDDIREPFMKEFFEFYSRVFGDPKRAGASVHLSSFQNECDRKVFYDLMGEPVSDHNTKVIDPLLQRIFDQGTWWHTYVQYHLYRSGVLEQAEVPVVLEEEFIKSRADGKLLILDKNLLLEIKTMNGFAFQKLSAPYDYHHYQASNYADILKLDGILYLYINKDSGDLKEFYEVPSTKFIKERTEKISSIKDYMSSNELPERFCGSRMEDRAANCPYCTTCFKH